MNAQALFCFSEALKKLKEGKKVTRDCWAGNKHICYRAPGEDSKTSKPYLYVSTGTDTNTKEIPTLSKLRLPWMPLPQDLFAEDWKVYE